MSNPENRKRPHVWHASPEINGLIRAYAAKRGITPNEAAEELIQGNVGTIVDAAGEIKRLTRERDELQEKLHHATLAGEDDSHALDVAHHHRSGPPAPRRRAWAREGA